MTRNASANRQRGKSRPSNPNVEWAIKSSVFIMLLAAIFFLGSGRLDWWMAWAYLGETVVNVVLSSLILMHKNPDMIAERLHPAEPEGVKAWDRMLVRIVAVYGPMLTWIAAALDKRFAWSPPLGLALQIVALAVVALGNLVTGWAMVANRYFSAVVRLQEDRGQTVCDTGPYRTVRHPGYVGSILVNLATPLALGSPWALVPGVLTACLTVIRTALEDRTLRDELDGYGDYAQRVRYRLLPGIW